MSGSTEAHLAKALVRGYTVTSQKDQIQGLIADIDGVLQKTTPRLPWVMSGEVTQQRQTLERVRNYLVALQRRMAIQDSYGQPEARADLLAHDIYQSAQPAQGNLTQDAESVMTAQQMLQAVVQEMNYLRTNLMQPLQSDLDALRQQRESLVQEIRQLEAQRQSYGALPPQVSQQQLINDFLQALMGRLQETLPHQIAQALGGGSNQSLPYGANPPLAGAYPFGAEQPTQPATDRLILNLDSTLKVIFESLERNVQAYQESLSQGLDRMHGLGQQGEMMFTALINHLAQQLGREASSYLQSSRQFVELDTDSLTGPEVITGEKAGVPAQDAQPAPTPSLTEPERGVSSPASEAGAGNLMLPYPGVEMPLPETPEMGIPADFSVESPPPAMSVDAAIDAWLKSANAASGINLEEQELSNLDLPGLNLTELDLNQIDLNQIDTQDLDALLESETGSDAEYLAAEAEVLVDQFPLPEAEATAEMGTEDIDAALKLLEQLSSELQDDPTGISLEAADAQIDRMLTSGSASGAVDTESAYPTPPAGIPEDARDELDEFYQSLFGSETETDASSDAQETAIASPITPSITQSEPGGSLEEMSPDPTLGWDLSPGDLSTRDQAADVLADTSEALSPEETQEPPAGTEATPVIAGEHPPLPTPGSDQISRLTDLFEDVTSGEGLRQEPDLATLPDNPPGAGGLSPEVGDFQPIFNLELNQGELTVPPEESYPPASPDEDLLGLDESSDNPNLGLWLDDLTLSSLSEDLSSFEEGISQAPPVLDMEEISAIEQPVLGDWGMEASQADAPEISLQDLAVSLAGETPALDTISEQFLPPAEPSTAAPTLEGMDDLFGDLPTAPDVSPATPPAFLSTAEDASFTLEGLGNLFADASPAPTVNPASPPGFTAAELERTDLEEIESLQMETSRSATAPVVPETSASVETPAEAPAAFILEGMDDLFEDAPAAAGSAPISPGSGFLSAVTDTTQSAPFTLEGLDDLFADIPSVEPSTPDTTITPEPVEAFTLEGMDDLFTDAPSLEMAETPDPPQPGIPSEPPTQFTLEQMGDVFMEVPMGDVGEPLLAPAMPSEPLTQFTLEQMGEVFVEVPVEGSPPVAEPSVSVPAADTESPTAFSLEQMGDLFIEVPSSSDASTVASTETPPEEFSLEQIGDLFVEVPVSEYGSADASAPSSAESADIHPQAPEKKKTI